MPGEQTRRPVSETAAGTEGAARVADVLLAFLDGPQSLGVSALARKLGLSKAVVHRILQALVQRGLLVTDPATRGYRLSSSTAALGARALRESDLRSLAMPVLRGLQAATGETTTLSATVPNGRVYLDQVESTREIKMTVELGRVFPLYAGSSSTCILAFLRPEQVEAVLAEPLEPLTDETLRDADAIRDRLTFVRHNGYASSSGERQDGAGAIAAPVFNFAGDVVGAISVCGPVSRFRGEVRAGFVPALIDAADTISRGLGWHGGFAAVSQEGS